MSKAGFDRHSRPMEAPRLSEYNFNIDISDIVSAMGRIRDTRWPKPVESDHSRRNPNLMCEYHGIHGHRIEDCRQLREEVARLINEGHLREFLSYRAKDRFLEREANGKNGLEEPQHIIHMIVGGTDVPQGPMFKRAKVPIATERQTRNYILEDALAFREEDIEPLSLPHNDALLGLLDQIIPISLVLNGFNLASETKKGEIILPVNMSDTVQDTKFHVIEAKEMFAVNDMEPTSTLPVQDESGNRFPPEE
ncbi:PREDICTED: uncharacterized protein LOC109215130 [Nicotiana attenuata]|uniref:uncharacterized protein LOC109215130 n=1 Tax=Nicotiana attenuata TaxID=49451 RepID=UPI000905D5CD|nr:PREDICTED: uncharacterized protein LOC109215130 [Nicotiana attenuata]